MEVSNRQWRALAQAYPYFFSPTAATEHAPGRGEVVEGERAVQEKSTKREDFEQYVVPRVSKAFQGEVAAWVEAHTDDCATPSTVDAAEALMTHFFGRRPVFASTSTPPPPSTTASGRVADALTAREVQLLSLYHRKQEQYEYMYGTHQQLLETTQAAVRTLQLALQTASTGAVEGSRDGGLLDSTRESLVWLGGAAAVAAAALSNNTPANALSAAPVMATTPESTGFTSALASLPYTVSTSAEEGGSHGPRLPVAAVVMNRCAGCGESDGDLLVCTQCGEVRHEACGGPHPPERSRVDGQLPAVNICRKCAKELNLSSSSSSLRSSTSSSERAELDEYFDSEEDTESSLSGFVVHSSDEDEGDEEDEEDEASSRGRSGGSRDASEDAEESGTCGHQPVPDRRRDKHAAPPSKSATREGRRDGHRRRNRDDISSSSSESTGRGHTHQQKKRQRTGNDTSRPRTGASSSEDDAPTSSLSKSSPSTRTAPRARGSVTATKASVQRGPKQQKAKGDVAPLSSQEKTRRLQDEEEELTMLGIPAKSTAGKKVASTHTTTRSQTAAPSGDASQQAVAAAGAKGKGGRRSVVNIASSSTSSDDSD